MHLVGSRELRPKLPAYLNRAERGDEFVILLHGHPAAIMRPFRIDDVGAIVSSALLRDEWHEAMIRVRTSSLIVLRYNHVVAVLEAPPASLLFKCREEAS